MVRALACHARGREFKSRHSRHFLKMVSPLHIFVAPLHIFNDFQNYSKSIFNDPNVVE